MKTYLLPRALTAVLPIKGYLKRIITLLLALAVSVILLANNAPHLLFKNSISIDTNGTIAAANDLHSNKFSINNTAGVSGIVGQDQFSLPLVMTAFTVVLNDKKVILTWTTGSEKRLNYFVIERSTNGTDFKEAAVIFSVTTSSVKQNYSFADPVNVSGKGMLYYRIRIVDVLGRFQNSAVKLIRTGEQNTVFQVQAYPNPVTNEVRITIPAKWQNQQVNYEFYNTSGRMVKRVTSHTANQTEIINMQDCNTGLYIVKAYTTTEASSQTIVKK